MHRSNCYMMVRQELEQNNNNNNANESECLKKNQIFLEESESKLQGHILIAMFCSVML